jgi:hypothetical protein
MPEDWLAQIHKPQTEAQLEALCRSVARGCPYGNPA